MADPADQQLHQLFAETLAFELGEKCTPKFVAASDRVLMRLWIEGYKLVPLPDEDADG